MEIDLAKIESLKHLHSVFKTELGFPEWYGMNWDAFWDSITGLIELKSNLKLSNFKSFEAAFSRDAEILNEIVNRFNKEGLPYKIELT